MKLLDRLRKIIDDLYKKKINVSTAQNRLSFIDWENSKDQYRHDKKVRKRIMDEYVVKYARTPEEVILDAEKIEEINALLAEIKGNLSTQEWDILYMSAVEGRTQEQIAQKYDTYQREISRKLEHIKEICLKITKNSIYSGEVFYERESTLEAHSPTSLGYPHEFLQHINTGGYWWTKRDGKKIFISRDECRIPEYAKAKCSLCFDNMGKSTCSRKEVN